VAHLLPQSTGDGCHRKASLAAEMRPKRSGIHCRQETRPSRRIWHPAPVTGETAPPPLSPLPPRTAARRAVLSTVTQVEAVPPVKRCAICDLDTLFQILARSNKNLAQNDKTGRESD